MAPVLVETPQPAGSYASKGIADYKEAYIGGPRAYKEGVETKGSAKQPPARYPNYLPTWDPAFKPDTPLCSHSYIMNMAKMQTLRFQTS